MLLHGKIGLICGVLNKLSIAWKIAEIFLQNNAKIIITYQNEDGRKRIESLLKLENVIALQCDVSNQVSIDNLFQQVSNIYNKIDFLIHAIAFSDKAELNGNYFNTSRANFLNAMNISCFSFTSLAHKFHHLMSEGGSMLTLSYYGSQKFVPNYNVMGVCKAALECSVRYLAMDFGAKNIRFNCISAGTIKTMAARGIKDFTHLEKYNRDNAPLKRNVTVNEIANTAMFLASDNSSGITGEIIYVDCGYNIVGIPKINDTSNSSTNN